MKSKKDKASGPLLLLIFSFIVQILLHFSLFGKFLGSDVLTVSWHLTSGLGNRNRARRDTRQKGREGKRKEEKERRTERERKRKGREQNRKEKGERERGREKGRDDNHEGNANSSSQGRRHT
jgi:hypothetical protein